MPRRPADPPVTGAWRDGDPVASRRFAGLGPVALEFGGSLPDVRVAYETFGQPRHDARGRISNAVLVLHALTGDAHLSGPAGPGQPTPGWWDAIIGPGRPLDTDEWFLVAGNVLGGCQGSTGPSSLGPKGDPWGSAFPRVTVRDQVQVEALLADRLGIDRFAAVIGGSMGGMRALEWAAMFPDRVAAALVLATGAAASADQIGTQTAQVLAIENDPNWHGGDYYGTGAGPHAGLGIARRIAHLTYRSEYELDVRFGRSPQEPGSDRFSVQSYLDHHAGKLARRFDAASYVTLTDAMNTHDVGRGRGGVEAALRDVTGPLVVVAGIDSDRLYPLRQQQQIADLVPTADGLHVIHSDHGHDGFLIEAAQVGELVTHTLRRAAGAWSAGRAWSA
ncbi:MAG TPA: homoserine O-acetyltransferase [Jatrophihabitans sp.]|uniref:homoserine O-acetyltransferase MetX n=1 Tax=Jatrophihabitans sp. TaxID=1932789 RepID=UPI002DF8C934|nr:homoserine O-acetyltransferase [Jatrophihabitans sp.]